MIEADKLIRSLRFRKHLNSLEDNSTEFIEIYASGINDYANNLLFLPFEFYLVGANFENWTIEDTLLIGKAMCFETSRQWVLTIARQSVLENLGKELADFLVPLELDDDYSTVFNEEDLKQMNLYFPKNQSEPDISFNFEKIINLNGSKLKDNQEMLSGSLEGGGSNSWVVHGNYTKSGKPLFAVDPHLSNKVPSTWYLLRVRNTEGINFFGITLTGLPAFVMGRTNNIAWGYTIAYAENLDLYKLKVNSEKTHYYYNSSWVPLKIHEEEIKIKNERPIFFKTYETHHGPVVFPTEKEEIFKVP